MSPPGPDIGNLLRQKQIMDSITNQGTQSAMMQPGIKQFDDTAGGSQGGVGQPYTGLPTPMPRRTPSLPAQAPTQGMTYEQAQTDPNRPVMLQRTPQGTSVPYGQMAQASPSISVGADGGLMVNQGGPPQVQAPNLSPIRMPMYDPNSGIL